MREIISNIEITQFFESPTQKNRSVFFAYAKEIVLKLAMDYAKKRSVVHCLALSGGTLLGTEW